MTQDISLHDCVSNGGVHRFGCRARVFNAGNARRNAGMAGASADYYNADNKDAQREKEQVSATVQVSGSDGPMMQIAMDTLDQLLDWIDLDTNGTSVGIFDAANTIIARRSKGKRTDCLEASLPLALLLLASDAALGADSVRASPHQKQWDNPCTVRGEQMHRRIDSAIQLRNEAVER